MTLKNRRRTSLKARMLGATRLNASTVIGSPRISDPSIGEHHRRVVGGGASFSPSDIASLFAWYDVSDLSTLFQDSAKTTAVASDGDPVGAIEDKTSNGYDLTQTTASAKPTYKTGINSYPALLCDGGDYLERDSVAFGFDYPLTCFGVFAVSAAVVTYEAISGVGVSTTHGLWLGRSTAGAGALQHTAGGLADPPEDYNDGNNRILIGQWTSDSAREGWEYTSGTSGTDATAKTLGGNIDHIAIGRDADSNPSFEWPGYIQEVIWYSAALDASDRLSVNEYLAAKWGVTAP